MKPEKVAVIGAGPGGLAAAMQLNRYGIRPIIFEGQQLGGLLHNANLVENYPGFPEGIPGPELVALFAEQVRVNGLQITYEHVNELHREEGYFHLSTQGGVYQARIVVIASGTKPRLFNDIHIPGEISEQIFYEVFPVLGLAGQQIAIVGAGDAAFDYALNLSRNNEVLILNRGGQISCLPLLWDRAQANPHIEYHENTRISTLSAAPDQKINIHCHTASGESKLLVDLLIGALGREPQLEFIPGHFREKAIQLENSGDLYFVGDVANGLYRQTAIAVGDGILAAMKIYRRIKENNW